MAALGIPAGFEDDDEYLEEDLLYFSHDEPKRLPQDVPLLAAKPPEKQPEQKAQQSEFEEFDWGTTSKDVSVKAFLTQPQPPTQDKPAAQPSILAPKPVEKKFIPLDDIRIAVINGNLNFLKEKLEQFKGELSIDTPLKSGWTALIYSAHHAKKDLVKFCLENGANANYRAPEGVTPLIASCKSFCENAQDILACVHALIDAGAKFNTKDDYNMTPLMFASSSGKDEIVKYILELDSNLDSNQRTVNKQDTKGWTALHFASYIGHGHIIRALLEADADPTVLCGRGQAPYDVAMDANHNEIASILERAYVKAKGQPVNHFSLNQDFQENHKNEKNEKNEKIEKKDLLTEDDAKKLAAETQSSYPPVIHTFRAEVIQTRRYDDLDTFLSASGLTHLIPMFREQQVTFKALLGFDDDDLIKMGINKIGVRQKILENIHQVHKKQWDRKSLLNIKDKTRISCPEACGMLLNISKHIDYIESTIAYLDCRIQRDASMLEYGQSAQYNVKRLWEVTHKAMEYNTKLNNRLKYFASHLEQLKEQNAHQLPDLIQLKPIGSLPGEDVIGTSYLNKIRKRRQTKQNNRLKITLLGFGLVAGVGSVVVWRWHNSDTEETFLSHLANKITQFVAKKNHSTC